ncbi:hypothetical protein GGI07_002163 [Coemansia sp. Benny D115]|nr:hypothetical protein GGI07_002163 [Coemansia sp. Benny D115]
MRLFSKYGPLVRAGPRQLGVGQVGLFRKMMSSHEMTKSQMYSDFAVMGENIFTTRDAEFNKRRRRQIGPAFTKPSISRMEPLVYGDGIQQVCNLFDKQIAAADGAHAVTNLYFAFTMMTTDIISSLALGHRIGAVNMLVDKLQLQASTDTVELKRSDSGMGELAQAQAQTQTQDGDELLETPENVMKFTVGTMMLMGLMAELPWIRRLPAWLRPSGIKKLYELRDGLDVFSQSTAARRRAQLQGRAAGGLHGEFPRHDILKALIEARDHKTGAMLTDKNIASEITVLLAAGTDTVSNALVSCYRLLLRHPAVYQRLKDEVREAHPVGNGTSVITFAQAQQLPYLMAVVYETLRLRASTSGAWPRNAPAGGLWLDGHYVPEGVVLYGSVGGTHLDEATWENARSFRPERFLGAAGEARRGDVMAFSSGVRICPGRHLGLMEMALALGSTVRLYDFSFADDGAADALVDGSRGASACADDVDEVCRITTGYAFPERDCNFRVSHAAVC